VAILDWFSPVAKPSGERSTPGGPDECTVHPILRTDGVGALVASRRLWRRSRRTRNFSLIREKTRRHAWHWGQRADMSESPATWNARLGLCRQEGPGHTAPVAQRAFVHNGVLTASHLCVLAQQGRLDEASAQAALRSIRAMQELAPGERYGCLRWYWEESAPVDTNAAFFIGLSLQLLYLAEGARLSAGTREAIRGITADLAVWFERELDAAQPRYANKCMGDLVCGWLGAEVLGRPPSAKLLRTTQAWGEYWRRERWGWGEHMSDIYTMVLLTEITALLLFGRQLPGDLRAMLSGLLEELLAIEDAFGGGPRVPQIRSYAFTDTAAPIGFRRFIVDNLPAAEAGAAGPGVKVRLLAEVYGPWFHRAGWEALAPAAALVPPWVEIPCHDGAMARAVVRPGFRLGAMSHYPVMAGVDHQTWGLSWQSFPAAFWRPAGDWGFWRWITREGNRVRGHPALDRHGAYLGNALSARVDPPPVPRMTSTLTPQGCLEIERRLPVPPGADWDEVKDAFCLLGSGATVKAEGARLHLRWPDAAITLRWAGHGAPHWEPRDGGGWWQVRYTREALEGRTELVHRWTATLA
jgi:hypothetical protein